MNNIPDADDHREKSLPPVKALKLFVQLKYRLVRHTVREDINVLRTIPGGLVLALCAVVLVAAAFGFFRVGIEETYAESLLFLLLAPIVGLLGWTPGLLLVVLFGIFELTSTSGELTPDLLYGRFVTYLVLYALVVLIPAAQRFTHARMLRITRTRAEQRRAWVVIPALTSALLAGGLAFLWATVAPYLIRPVFVASAGRIPAPRIRGMVTLQSNELLIAVVVFTASLLIALSLQRRGGIAHGPRGFGPGFLLRSEFAWVGRVLRYGFLLVILTGVITGLLDVFLIVGALLASEVLLGLIARVGPIRDTIVRVSWPLRVVFAFGITVGVTLSIIEWHYSPLGGSEFFPFTLSLAIGLLVFRLLLDIDEAAMEQRVKAAESETQTLLPVGTIVALIVLVSLAGGSDVVAADDCSGLNDCANVAGAAIASGFAAIAAAAWYMMKGVFSKVPPVLGELEPLLSEEGAQMEYDTFVMLRRKVAVEYATHTGNPEDYYRVQQMSADEFVEFVQGQHETLSRPSGGFSVFGRSG